MSDEGNVNGEIIDSPTVNSYVVGVMVAPPAPPNTPDSTAPSITSLDPSTGEAGAEPFVLHIHGSNIANDVTVWMGGVAVNTGYVSSTQVDTMVDAPSAAEGNTDVWIVDGGGTSNTVTFTFTAPTGP